MGILQKKQTNETNPGAGRLRPLFCEQSRRHKGKTDSCPSCCQFVGKAVSSPASEKAGLGRASRKQGWAWISGVKSGCVDAGKALRDS